MTIHFLSANGMQEVIAFQTSAYAFCNPCSEVVEFVVCTHVNQARYNELNSPSSNMLASQSGMMNQPSVSGAATNTALLNSANFDSTSQYSQYNLHNLSSQYATNPIHPQTHLNYQSQHLQTHIPFQQPNSHSHHQLNSNPSSSGYGNYLMMQSLLTFSSLFKVKCRILMN